MESMKKKILILVGVLIIGVLIFGFLRRTKKTETGHEIRTQVFGGNISFSEPPALGQKTELIFTIHPMFNSSDITVRLGTYGGIEVIGSRTWKWNGTVNANETVSAKFFIKPVETGEWVVGTVIEGTIRTEATMIKEDITKGFRWTDDPYRVYLHVTENKVTVSKTPPTRFVGVPTYCFSGVQELVECVKQLTKTGVVTNVSRQRE